MADWIPRFADVKSVEDLCKVIAYPMLIAAHILQTGFEINVPEMDVFLTLPSSGSIGYVNTIALIIFLGKSAYISLVGLIVHMAVGLADKYTDFELLKFITGLMLAFGLVGVLAVPEKFPQSLQFNKAWYYAAFVFAFYLNLWKRENEPSNQTYQGLTSR